MIAEAIPEAVLGIASNLIGRPVKVVPLGGMSDARVMRVSGPTGSLVVKAGMSPRELAVYRLLSPVLNEAGIRIPALHGWLELLGEAWVLLEAIPHALPRGRWLADAEVLAILQRLHQLAPEALDLLPDRFQPAWTPEMDRVAMRWLGDDTAIAERLDALRMEAVPLFEPHGVISGDPNPLNWGLSDASDLVLMDWERIGLGHPAIDLAITNPGLPAAHDFELTATVYQAFAMGQTRGTIRIDSRDLILAKLWTLIEFLAESPRLDEDTPVAGPLRRRQETAVMVARSLPHWLDRLS